MKLIARGAEAAVYSKQASVVKHRVRKTYRIHELDEKLRKIRTRQEAKILERLYKADFPCPEVIGYSDTTMKLELEKISGKKLRDVLSKDNYKDFANQLGHLVATLHNNNIIHGDLTTSNMIVKKDHIYFIDFGLGFFSDKVENKAVDIHLLRQALFSKHPDIAKKTFKLFLEEYASKSNSPKLILNRLEKVEKRGRYKQKN